MASVDFFASIVDDNTVIADLMANFPGNMSDDFDHHDYFEGVFPPHLTPTSAINMVTFLLPIVGRLYTGTNDCYLRSFLREGQRIMLTYLKRAEDTEQDYLDLPERREVLANWFINFVHDPLRVHGYTMGELRAANAAEGYDSDTETDYDGVSEPDLDDYELAEEKAIWALEHADEAQKAYEAIPLPDGYDSDSTTGETEDGGDERDGWWDA